MSSKNVNSFSTIDTVNTYSNSSLLAIVSGNLTRLTSGNLVLNKVNASNLIYNTGNQIISDTKTFNLPPIISGNPFITGNLSLYATIINLSMTGSALDIKINNLSGYVNTQDNNISTNLYNTGNTLNNRINSLSGYTDAQDTNISNNLITTGTTLNTKINNLSGYVNTQDTTISNNLTNTGSALDNKINSLSGSSVLLYGNQSIGGVKTFRDNVYINNLYVTGTETIINTAQVNVASNYLLLNLTGGAVDGGIFFVTGSGFTGVNDPGPIIGFDHINKFKFGISTRNSDLSTLPDIASVQQIEAYSGIANNTFSTITNLYNTGNNLNNKINSLSGWSASALNLASTGSILDSKINSLSGWSASAINLASTGSILNTRINNLSGYINSANSNIVFTTGDQNIGGNKTLTDKLNITASANSDSTLKVGTLEFQPYSVNNAWLGDNTYYSGGFYRREAGYAGAFYFQGAEGQFRFADTDDAATTYTPAVQLKTHLDGRFGVGSNISTATADFTNSNFFVDSNGDVGINTVDPTEKLQVNGNIKFGEPGTASATLYMYDSPNDEYNTATWTDSELQLTQISNSSALVILFSPEYNTLVSNGSYLKLPTGKNDFIAMDGEVVHKTGDETISGVKTFIGNHNIIGNTTITGNLNVSGMIRTPQQNKTFVYRPNVTGAGSTNGIIAYGANCTITPKYVGTLRADACISMTQIGGSSTDTVQTTSFWYGTGTAPVYSGNLVNLGATRIGGIKCVPTTNPATTLTNPFGTSWVAEITGLNTGTQYWFDIGISGLRVRVQDIQLYIEEKY